MQRDATSKSYTITIPTQPKLSDASNQDRDGNGLIEIRNLEGLYEIHTHLALDVIPAHLRANATMVSAEAMSW